ncbi:uncharacterized protein STEHIDRAFT_91166 [Stereum hirsutum FP-91666 SS1]|uniref:uncharacterized protein n=1 Tax=Stereum hirsutum (strain FP-91666) TaxID=721885 RepID=UPI000440EC1E|nr:uncharacterized protein STEHIDRAFT_91166 [Stereum hirsutum FP-91666 SS1]EIM91164.1 hypothetical protein STEHIDRAFT_91166 [Stereum hirsutum FP-91666 SS1]
MSCGNPDADPAETLMPRKPKYDRGKNCIKCKDAGGSIVIRHAVYCKNCFQPLISAKFRKTLEPHINLQADGPRRSALKPAGDLLVGISGGLGSTVLLDLVHRTYLAPRGTTDDYGGKSHPRKDKVWKKIRVCYVELCDAFSGMEDRTEMVRSSVERYEGFEFIALRVQDAFDPAWWLKTTGAQMPASLSVDLTNEDLPLSSSSSGSPPSPLSSLQTYLRSLPTQTAIPTSISTLVRVLLCYTAKSTGSSHLVLGTSLTSLSIALISSISQGGGFVVPQESYEEWSLPKTQLPATSAPSEMGKKRKKEWKGEVRVVRPLREIGMKECAAWAWWNELPVVGKEKLPGIRQTVGGLTKDFIVGLEKDFPSTVSTIARTCGKLAPKDEQGENCALCERPAQRTVQDWKARISIRSITAENTPSAARQQTLTPRLCYSCHTTLTSKSPRSVVSATKTGTSTPTGSQPPSAAVPLPVWVASNLCHSTGPGQLNDGQLGLNAIESSGALDEELWERKKMDEDKLKGVIGEFLLEEA